MRTKFILGGLAALLMTSVWLVPARSQQPAPPPIPDSAAQRQQMIAELQQANRQLAAIAKLLTEIRDQRPATERTGD